MKKMQVLHVLSTLSIKSGVASVLMNYCRYLDYDKIGVSIIYFDDRGNETYIEELGNLGIRIFQFHRSSFFSDWVSFCKEHYGEFDILHNHETFLAPFFVGVKKKLGVKKLVTHAHVTRFGDTPIKNLRNGILSLPCRFISDQLAGCSEEAGIALFGQRFKKNGFVMKNAIRADKFTYNEEKRNKIREEYGLEGHFVVGHIGNMCLQKNHLFLLDVFSEILKINSTAKLLLIGDGPLRHQIEEHANVLGISEQIILLGARYDVNDLLNAMDVFLFPSVFEGLGIVLIEAQTNGLRCIYSDQVPAEADLIPANNKCLSLKIDKSIWAQEVCSAKGRVNTSEIIRNSGYDIRFEAEKLIEFYKNVLN